MNELPIDAALPDLVTTLDRGANLVLEAAPGAGKTTRVPLALLDRPWAANKKILVLEPRRIAARAAARFMASSLGEAAGETVGYRVRHDTKVSARTRIELLTDGLYLRRLKADPGLDDVACVIFDEVHERGLESDLALTLTMEAQAALRPDLRLVAMSATLDGERFATLLKAERIVSEGRSFPVDTYYRPPRANERREDAVAAAIRQSLADYPGDLLVFLPGGAEIRRVAERLERLPVNVVVYPLHGDLGREAQDAAIAPSPPGQRKIVLATAIAETSLTIEGVRVVIDAGLARLPRFDLASGMTRLVTERVSQAAAEQRRGRAGRVAPGVCIRLWSEAEQRALPPRQPPEIMVGDLAPLALDLADWGTTDPESLAWLDPPPATALTQARDLLQDLGAIDEAGQITAHGRQMAAFGTHPRLAHMILTATERGHGLLGCLVAALIDERDLLRGRNDGIDLRHRVDLLRGRERGPVDRAALAQARKSVEAWTRQIPPANRESDPDPEMTGAVLALAYPDRIAQARPTSLGRYRLRNGRGAVVAETDPLARSPWLAIADLDGQAREARVFRAAPIEEELLLDWFGADIREETFVAYDEREAAVKAVRRRTLGALVLSEKPLANVDPDLIATGLIGAVRKAGLSVLPFTPALMQWRARVMLLRRLDEAGGWPDLSDEALLAGLDDWLRPHLAGLTKLAQLKNLDLTAILHGLLDWSLRQRLGREAPDDLQLPAGGSARLDYLAGDEPVLRVKLQQMFGQADTPTIANGRQKVLVELLSPAGRPLQVTRDLGSFWNNAYREVRAEMRGRYPKHDWPDDPANALPHRGLKRTAPKRP